MTESPAPEPPRVWLRHMLLGAAALAAALIALLSYATGALSGLERQTIDARFGIRGGKGPDARIVIVGLDPSTYSTLHARPPIPRAYFARALDRLHAAHPRLLVLDFAFTGRSDSADDGALLTAFARDAPVLVGAEELPDGTALPPADSSRHAGAILVSLGVDTDPGGVLRRMMYSPVRLPTLAVQASGLVQGRAVDASRFPGDHAWVDFRGTPGTFPHLRFTDILDGRFPASAVQGKIVLIGNLDPLGKDVFITPVSSVPMAGVEFHANAISTILNGFPLQPLNGAVEVLLLVLLAALPAALTLRFDVLQAFGTVRVLGSGALAVLGIVAAVGAAFLVFAQIAFDGGTIVSVPDPLLALFLGTAGAFSADAYIQRRQLRDLQRFWNRLPSPVSDFFISYRRAGSESVANALRGWLTRRFGEQSVFMDTEAIEPGQAFPHRIAEAIAACNAMLVLICPGWQELQLEGSPRLHQEADWVRREIEAGLADPEIVVVPVLHDGAAPLDRDTLPESLKPLADCQTVYWSGADPERWIDELADRIHRGKLRAAHLATASERG